MFMEMEMFMGLNHCTVQINNPIEVVNQQLSFSLTTTTTTMLSLEK